MKVLSFSEPEILQGLLRFFETNGKEGKDQTIRPAWEYPSMKLPKRVELEIKGAKNKKEIYKVINKLKGKMKNQAIYGVVNPKKIYVIDKNGMAIKSSRFNVGDNAILYWKQRTSPKGSMFCRICGSSPKKVGDFGWENCYCSIKNGFFPKILGSVQIEEVLEIEMVKCDG
jgi:hypothetical protein